MSIRPYTDADLGELLDLWHRASLIAHPFLSPEFLEAERRQIAEHWLPMAETTVYELEGRVVGFLSLIDNEVGGIFVDPDYQSRGIGRALMDGARESRPFLELGVFEANAIGRRFYDKYGFEFVARHLDESSGQPELRLRFDGARHQAGRMADMSSLSPEEKPVRTFGWQDMFVHPDDDPRTDGPFENNERATLVGYLGDYRLTLELKCADLDAEAMARRSVPPSDLSLLGLVRHLAGVERYWFRRVMAGEDVASLYENEAGEDAEFEVDPAMVSEAWDNWRTEVGFAEAFVDDHSDLGIFGKGRHVPLRDVLVHLIEEYARHMGHADLLRERIDGRVGQ